jgi:hypothetical protein
MYKTIAFPILILFGIFSCYGQSWPKMYQVKNKHMYVTDLLEDYDRGIVIAGFTGWNDIAARYAMLLKTDINGNLLWEKKLGNANYQCFLSRAIKINNHEYIICGSITKYDPWETFDPCFIKLNACGELEWCTVLQSPDDNYATGVVPLADGNFIGMLKYYGGDYEHVRISLVKLDHSGQPLWIKHLAQEDSLIRNEEGYDFKVLHDGNCLVTGSCPYNGEKAYWILTDTAGELIWDLKWDMPGSGPCVSFETSQNKNNFLYSVGGMIRAPGIGSPVLYKLDINGNALYHAYLLGDTILGGAMSLCLYDDTSIIVGVQSSHDPSFYEGNSDDLIKLYPNPVLTTLHFVFKTPPDHAVISVYNSWSGLVGQMNVPAGATSYQSDFSMYPPGLYMAVFRTSKGILAMEKFIVMH